MRVTTKVISALVLAGSLVGFVGSPAQAAKPRHSLTATSGTSGTAGSGSTAAKPRHDLTVSAKEIGGDSDRFKLYGRVTTYLGQDLRIERKVNTGPFEAWATETTSADKGKFSLKIYGGKRGSTVCYRVIVPATSDHRRTQGDRWCIKTKADRLSLATD